MCASSLLEFEDQFRIAIMLIKKDLPSLRKLRRNECDAKEMKQKPLQQHDREWYRRQERAAPRPDRLFQKSLQCQYDFDPYRSRKAGREKFRRNNRRRCMVFKQKPYHHRRDRDRQQSFHRRGCALPRNMKIIDGIFLRSQLMRVRLDLYRHRRHHLHFR